MFSLCNTSYLLLFLILIPSIAHSQVTVQADIASKQADITLRNGIINADNTAIGNSQEDIVVQQAGITADNATIAADQSINATYLASVAQTASGVNWDYFVTLEPQIPFSTWSKVDSGINWTSVVPSLGINCGGITEANVNWTNWGNCEAKGMTPGSPFGGKNTGIAAFWCGNGNIAGTC